MSSHHQDFISKASQLLKDAPGRHRLVSAATQRIAERHNSDAEKEAFSRLARDLKAVLCRSRDRGRVNGDCSESEERGGGDNRMEADGKKPHVRFMLPGGKQVGGMEYNVAKAMWRQQ